MMGKRMKALIADGGSSRTLSEAMIDATLADSFPASDPPSWTLGREVDSRASRIEHLSQTMKTQSPKLGRKDAEMAIIELSLSAKE